jgi:WD40 repeat protein
MILFDLKQIINAFDVSPDGKTIVVCTNDQRAYFLDIEERIEHHRVIQWDDIITSIAFSPDSQKIALGYLDGIISVRDVLSSSITRSFLGKRRITSIVFTESYIVYGSQGYLHIWDVRNNSPIQEQLTILQIDEVVSDLAIAYDQKTIYSSLFNGEVLAWDAEKFSDPETVVSAGFYINSIALSPDASKIAIASDFLAVILWNIDSKTTDSEFRGHRLKINSVAFSPDGSKIASGGDDGQVIVWGIKSKRRILQVQAAKGKIRTVKFLPCGTKIVSASRDGVIAVWNC